MSDLRLLVFDVDGTLVDSQHAIIAAMAAAYGHVDAPAPGRAEILSIVGLSLPEAVRAMTPDLSGADCDRVVAAYRAEYLNMRARGDENAPLYDGIRDLLFRLNARPDILIGAATGKARRGLDHVIASHDLDGIFVTLQTSDFHPSKPHPAMLEAAIAEAGAKPDQTLMIGDTSFDMEMAKSAGCRAIAVAWGYHDQARLLRAGADCVVQTMDDLQDACLT